jgi:dTDP-4-amino-4,6-dideoxygalactose transaminase
VPAHLQNAYKYRGYKKGDLPVTETMVDRILSLPMYPELTDEQVGYVIKLVRKYLLENPKAQLVQNNVFQSAPVSSTIIK